MSTKYQISPQKASKLLLLFYGCLFPSTGVICGTNCTDELQYFCHTFLSLTVADPEILKRGEHSIEWSPSLKTGKNIWYFESEIFSFTNIRW